MSTQDNLKPTKPDTNPDKLTANQIAYQTLRREGFTGNQASKRLGLSSGYGAHTDKRLRNVGCITDSKFISAAMRAHNKIIRGKAVGDADPPKTSDVNRCIDRVLERSHPVKQTIVKTTLNLTGSISELAEYQGTSAAMEEVIELTEETPGEIEGGGMDE